MLTVGLLYACNNNIQNMKRNTYKLHIVLQCRRILYIQCSFKTSLPAGNALGTLFSCTPFLIELNNEPLPPPGAADDVANILPDDAADPFK